MKINNILNFTKASMLSVGIAICVAVSAPIYAAELKVQVQSDFGQLDPAFWASQSDRNVIHAIYPKLIEFKSSKKDKIDIGHLTSLDGEQFASLFKKFVRVCRDDLDIDDASIDPADDKQFEEFVDLSTKMISDDLEERKNNE